MTFFFSAAFALVLLRPGLPFFPNLVDLLLGFSWPQVVPIFDEILLHGPITVGQEFPVDIRLKLMQKRARKGVEVHRLLERASFQQARRMLKQERVFDCVRIEDIIICRLAHVRIRQYTSRYLRKVIALSPSCRSNRTRDQLTAHSNDELPIRRHDARHLVREFPFRSYELNDVAHFL